MQAQRTEIADPAEEAEAIKTLMRAHRDLLRDDPELLTDLGVRLDVANLVDFGPVALSRVTAAHQRESSERKRLEAISAANFTAQAQTHAAVVELMEAQDHADLARRLDELARLRFGLAAGVVAVEGAAPFGWRALAHGQVDLILGFGRRAQMGHMPTALGLFGDLAPLIGSVALVRVGFWSPTRAGVLAFGAADPGAFTADMGADLVAFLARVTERTAQRWPAP